MRVRTKTVPAVRAARGLALASAILPKRVWTVKRDERYSRAEYAMELVRDPEGVVRDSGSKQLLGACLFGGNLASKRNPFAP